MLSRASKAPWAHGLALVESGTQARFAPRPKAPQKLVQCVHTAPVYASAAPPAAAPIDASKTVHVEVRLTQGTMPPGGAEAKRGCCEIANPVTGDAVAHSPAGHIVLWTHVMEKLAAAVIVEAVTPTQSTRLVLARYGNRVE